MKAVRWHARRDVRVDEVPEPAAGPGEVVVRVAACGLCGSDLHEYLDGPLYIPRGPHPLTGQAPPVTLGHEFCGRVVDVGPGVSTVRTGDRVAVNPCLSCGTCRWCRRGQPNHCARLGSLGLSRDGALAPLVAVPASGCHVLPADVGDEAGAFVEPLAVVLHACRRARLTGGEHVAVIGAGPIGLLLVQVLRMRVSGWVAVVEPREARRRLARALGADVAVDPGARDPAAVVAELSEGERAAVAFECVGQAGAFESAFRVVGKGGRVVVVGLVPERAPANLLGLVAHEKEIVGSSAYVDEFPEAIDLLAAGRVRVEPLVTGRIELADTLPRGLEALLRPEAQHVKILVAPE